MLTHPTSTLLAIRFLLRLQVRKLVSPNPSLPPQPRIQAYRFPFSIQNDPVPMVIENSQKTVCVEYTRLQSFSELWRNVYTKCTET